MNQTQRKLRSRRIWRTVEIACIGAFFALLGIIILRYINFAILQREQYSAQDALASIQVNEDGAEMPVIDKADTELSKEPPPVLGKAARLLKENADLVGLVRYGDITLYVCQGDDNNYYASHRFDGSEDPAGMIYMDFRCSIWPQSDNIILYGHNMRNGSRFGELKRYTRTDYLAKYPSVRFASLYEIYDYLPIAVFYTNTNPMESSYFDFVQVEFASEEDFSRYIDKVRSMSVLKLTVDVAYGDHLLTLVTCSGDGIGGRLVVVCVQVRNT